MTLTAVAPQLDSENPWPGLESFTENAQAFFFGREAEAASLSSHLLDNPVTVLFGRSGLGKTSLLQAGLFPRLRQRNLLPVYVRLQFQIGAAPLSQQLLQSIHTALRAEVPDAMVPADDETLWEYLHRRDFELWSAQNQLLTPVIVVDQFEEIFTLGDRVPDLVESFRDDLGDLAENRIPAALAARIDQHEAVVDRFDLRARTYKLVVSLREDYLPALDEWSPLIPSLGRSRIRLRGLRADRALDAVREPAGSLISDQLAHRVVSIVAASNISSMSDAQSVDIDSPETELEAAEVEPALLSLFCRELNEERKRRGMACFDRELVEDARRHTLSNYYASCVSDLDPRVARFIESHLITENGFRTRYIREDAIPKHLAEDELERLIQARLVRLEEDRFGAQWIELTHDVLTGIVREHRDARRAEEEKSAFAAREAEFEVEKQQQLAELQAAKRRTRVLTAALALTVVVSLVAIFLGWRAQRLEAQANESLRIATGQKLISQAQSILDRDEPGTDVQALQELLAARALTPAADELYTALAKRVDTLKIIDIQENAVRDLAFSADGRLVSGSDDAVVRFWNAETGAEAGAALEPRDEWWLALSPDGSRLASVGDDGTLRLRDTADGRMLRETIDAGNVPTGAFSFRGDRIALAGWDGTVQVWDTASGRAVGAPLKGHTEQVLSLAFSLDGRRLATAGADATVRLWNLEDGRQIQVLTGHTNTVANVAFSPDGRRLATGSWDRTVRLWDVESGAQLGDPMTSPSGPIIRIAFSPDGARLAAAGIDNTIRLWDLETRQTIGDPLVGHSGVVATVVFSPDGSRLASASWDGTVRLWPSDSKFPLRGHGDDVARLTFNEDGTRLASAGKDGTVRLWNPDTGDSLGAPLVQGAVVNDIAISTDGRLASAGDDGTVRFWDSASGQPIAAPLVETDPVYLVQFSPDGDRLVTISGDHTVRLWNVNSDEPTGIALEGLTESVLWVEFDDEGRRLVTASADDMVRLWDAHTGKSIGDPFNHPELTDASFSPDGNNLATVSWDGGIRLWNTSTGEIIREFPERHILPVDAVHYSPAGDRLATTLWNDTVQLWDPNSGSAIGEPLRHTSIVTTMRFSPDGRHLATASGDNVVRLWNTETGELYGAPLTGHTDEVTSVVFSPDGSRLASASADDSVRLWPAEGSSDQLCDKLTENMTRQQWDEWVSPAIEYDDYMPLCDGLPTP